MEIAPQEVQQKRFDEVKRGFDTQQVGLFLEMVAAAMADRDRQLHEAHTEIAALHKTVSHAKENEEAFRLTMMVATEAKEQMLEQAREEAEQIEADARSRAEVLTERAKSEAGDRFADLKRQLALLEAERDRLETEITDLGGVAPPSPPRRPPLELVVDRQEESPAGAEGLAARVGDLRG